MCIDNSPFLADEEGVLKIFRILYSEAPPNARPPLARCHHSQVIKSRWLGTIDQLNAALTSLVTRGCLSKDKLASYCITDCGLRKVRALPPNPGSPC
jgi:hypothetical protein